MPRATRLLFSLHGDPMFISDSDDEDQFLQRLADDLDAEYAIGSEEEQMEGGDLSKEDEDPDEDLMEDEDPVEDPAEDEDPDEDPMEDEDSVEDLAEDEDPDEDPMEDEDSDEDPMEDEDSVEDPVEDEDSVEDPAEVEDPVEDLMEGEGLVPAEEDPQPTEVDPVVGEEEWIDDPLGELDEESYIDWEAELLHIDDVPPEDVDGEDHIDWDAEPQHLDDIPQEEQGIWLADLDEELPEEMPFEVGVDEEEEGPEVVDPILEGCLRQTRWRGL